MLPTNFSHLLYISTPAHNTHLMAILLIFLRKWKLSDVTLSSHPTMIEQSIFLPPGKMDEVYLQLFKNKPSTWTNTHPFLPSIITLLCPQLAAILSFSLSLSSVHTKDIGYILVYLALFPQCLCCSSLSVLIKLPHIFYQL